MERAPSQSCLHVRFMISFFGALRGDVLSLRPSARDRVALFVFHERVFAATNEGPVYQDWR